MNLLFITQKPYHKHLIKDAFAQYANTLSYTLDAVCITGYIVSDEEITRFGYAVELFEPFSMTSRDLPDGYKIHRDTLPQCREESLAKIKSGTYDYLVNACDHDEAGDLMFDYTRETCDVLNIPTLRFNLFAFICERAHGAERAFKEIEAQLAALTKEA